MMKGLGVLVIVLLVIGGLIFGPLAVIWSVNTLFGMAIPYTLATWAAAMLLCSALRANVSVKK